MNLETDYLTQQIIAYIGNKRKLLGLILKAIQESGIDMKPGLKFFDVFSGSGVVSRLAKSLNFEVYANDWEYYSFVLSNCYLKINRKEIKRIFGSEAEFENQLEKINSLSNPDKKNQYIAKYYAPKSDDINAVDYKTERLFYTRRNALNIDKIRNYIEAEFPLENISAADLKKRNLFLAELIYEAATHNNTSGVFKACHKGFGGHNRDALSRILGEIKLHVPVLIDSDYPVHVFQEDSNELVKKIRGIDIAYLDPPYNQHQYGSNYHLLNTIAKWDHIPAKLELNEKGELKEKAAIRHDWINTRSNYCYKQKATEYFEDLIDNLDSKIILISYSTDGIIPFEEMQRICMKKGKVSIVTNEYTTYRGGKQSNKRQNTNIEFILCIDTTKKASKETCEQIEYIFTRKKSMLIFKQKFNESKLKDACTKVDGDSLIFKINGKKIGIRTNSFFTLEIPEELYELPTLTLLTLNAKLESCACQTKEEELEQIISKLDGDFEKSRKFIRLIPPTLRKLAHKKNREAFYSWLKKIQALENEFPDLYPIIRDKINATLELAEIRFST